MGMVNTQKDFVPKRADIKKDQSWKVHKKGLVPKRGDRLVPKMAGTEKVLALKSVGIKEDWYQKVSVPKGNSELVPNKFTTCGSFDAIWDKTSYSTSLERPK